MPCRGIRGATTVESNDRDEILDATREMLQTLIAANDLEPASIASAIFTTTADLDAAFPAQAARELGWIAVPLLDAVEVNVTGALPRCIRVLVHWNTDASPATIRHVYLRDAARLRPEWALTPGEPATLAPAPLASVPRETEIAVAPLDCQTAETTVAYQGEPGAYSQEAIYQHFGPGVCTLPCRTFEEIFAAVEANRATYGLLPIENSQAGSVHQAYDLLLDHDLKVIGEVMLRVRHCLLAPDGASPDRIRHVRSHPQALAQCAHYLSRQGWEAVPAYDTAGAARELAASPEPGTAAIASALAGQIYGLSVLAEGIEDAYDNTTRFFLLGREQAPAGPNSKTSLVFATSHTPGALHRALGELASRGINMTKLESRPRRNRPWHYVFYLDLEGHWHDPVVEEALLGLLARSAFVKFLGSYPAAPTRDK